jgi:hypothetical protein
MNDTQYNHGVIGRVVFVNHNVGWHDVNADMRPKGRAGRAAARMIRQAVIELVKGSTYLAARLYPALSAR